MPEWGAFIGGFVRWLFKGCKTNLRDELEGNLDAKWGGTYEIENYVIGIITTVIILGVIIWLFFWYFTEMPKNPPVVRSVPGYGRFNCLPCTMAIFQQWLLLFKHTMTKPPPLSVASSATDLYKRALLSIIIRSIFFSTTEWKLAILAIGTRNRMI